MSEEFEVFDENLKKEVGKYIDKVTYQTKDEGIYSTLLEFLKKYRKEHNKTMIECEICLEEIPEDKMYKIQPCGHQYCYNCIKDHIKSNIAQGKEIVLCPEAGCDSILNIFGMYGYGIIDEKTLHEYEKISFSVSITKNESIKKCPKCQRSLIIGEKPKVGEEKKVQCPICKYQFCKNCGKDVCLIIIHIFILHQVNQEKHLKYIYGLVRKQQFQVEVYVQC